MVPRKPGHSSDDLFRSRLEAMIDTEHPLVKLAGLIDWSRFDAAFGRFYTQKGRPGLPTRLMAGLHLLKHMEGLSDEAVCARWVENPYYQFFCGEEFFRHKLVLDRSSMTRWWGRIGADQFELLLAETLSVAMRTEATTPAACERVTVETTVQTKAIAHPTDSHLLMRGIERLNRLARRHHIKLRQSFLRVGRRARRDASRLIHGRGHKQAALGQESAHLAWPARPRYRPQDHRQRRTRGRLRGCPRARRQGARPEGGRQRQALCAARARGRMYRQGQGAGTI